jgi:anti-anti-sigma regulatory factor
LLWFGNELAAKVTVVEFGDQLFDEAARREFCERITQLAAEGGRDLLVDLSNLRFVSSSVLGVLLQLSGLSKPRAGRRLCVA